MEWISSERFFKKKVTKYCVKKTKLQIYQPLPATIPKNKSRWIFQEVTEDPFLCRGSVYHSSDVCRVLCVWRQIIIKWCVRWLSLEGLLYFFFFNVTSKFIYLFICVIVFIYAILFIWLYLFMWFYLFIYVILFYLFVVVFLKLFIYLHNSFLTWTWMID